VKLSDITCFDIFARYSQLCPAVDLVPGLQAVAPELQVDVSVLLEKALDLQAEMLRSRIKVANFQVDKQVCRLKGALAISKSPLFADLRV
jgi:hypothetical protein